MHVRFIKKKMIVTLFPLILLLLVTVLASGCISESVETITVPRTGTAIVTGTGTGVTAPAAASFATEKNTYRNGINDLTSRAKQINADYSALIDKYNSGQANNVELQTLADLDRTSYEEMIGKLTEMKVPAEFQEAHKLLISGFNKLHTTFVDYRDGYGKNDQNMLNTARDLDNQAVTEINQAVNIIVQVQ